MSDNTTAVFSTAKEVERMGQRMEKVKALGIHFIPVVYLNAVESNGYATINVITSRTLCDWGKDPSTRVPKEEAKSSKSKSIYTKSVQKSVTLKLKDGLAVDPDSCLEDVAHVYVSHNNDRYNAVLGITDIQRNKNSYYKLQLLEGDNKNRCDLCRVLKCKSYALTVFIAPFRYWIFRSWGRIGTTIGGNKLEEFSSLFEAQQAFEAIYLEKSGNNFENRANFVKVP